MPDLFSPLVERAIELAAQWHDGTYRKGRWRELPYEAPEHVRVPVMAHLTAVAFTVQRAGWGDAVVAAAFLHDVLEDGNRHGMRLSRKALETVVGAEVYAIVEGVTERKRDAEGNERPWRLRKEEYAAQLRQGRPEAAAVSLADKQHNLWSMNQALEQGLDVFTSGERRRALNAGPAEQRWFFRAVLDASRPHADERLSPMRVRLEEEIERFEALTGTG